jgi:hypothetical protein
MRFDRAARREQDRPVFGRARIGIGVMGKRIVGLVLAAQVAFLPLGARAADLNVLAQGFKDEEPCSAPFAKTLNIKVFGACVAAVEGKFKGTAAAKQDYVAGASFNAWLLANYVASAVDKDLFPDIPSRAKASKQRQFAMTLFDQFRQAQKQQGIADADLAKAAGVNLTGLKPVLDYYDGLPKK